ncbi:LOW QUALITY PROTEIN: carbonyl reductase [NADPH] 1-like, partial [Lycaon pictus]
RKVTLRGQSPVCVQGSQETYLVQVIRKSGTFGSSFDGGTEAPLGAYCSISDTFLLASLDCGQGSGTPPPSPWPKHQSFTTQAGACTPCNHVVIPHEAVVTGANKSLDFAISRDLCRNFPGDMVLTVRDQTRGRGRAARQHLKAEGLSLHFHLLAIDNLQSIRTLRDFLWEEFGGLDVLVNNAGITFKSDDPTPLHIQAEVTLKTNFFGTDICTELLPLVKPQGRVVNVSSVMGFVTLKQCIPELQKKFTSEAITEEELGMLMDKFVEDVKNGVHKKEGWPDMKLVTYGISKMGITILSRIHARKLSEQRRDDKILLNACCPGWVRTDMGGADAIKSPEDGAETPVYLALLPSDAEGPHGEFVMEKQVEQ